MKHFFLLIISIFSICSCQNEASKSTLEKIFDNGSDQFKHVISNTDKYEIQVLFSPVRENMDSIFLEDHFYNFRPDEYFYPASTVKIPVAFLALQKLEELQKSGLNIDLFTPLTIDSLRQSQSWVKEDSTSKSGMPSIAHYLNKIFMINDDDAFNRLFEFTTQDYINSHLHNKGIFTNSRIVHRLGEGDFSFEDNKWAPSINFLNEEGVVFHKRQPTYAQGFWLTPISKTQKGIGYFDDKENKVDKPFDFSKMNFVNIKDLQESLKRMILPSLYPIEMQYNIGKVKRIFILEHDEILHRNEDDLRTIKEEYDGTETNFFLFGDKEKPINDNIKVKGLGGYDYGYITECAYIQDDKHDIEYFLTATIYVNENQVFNDSKYEYDEVGIPFLAELGRLVHQYMIDEKQ